MSEYVRGLRVALDIAERQLSDSHNESWNRAVAAVVELLNYEIEEADAYAEAVRELSRGA